MSENKIRVEIVTPYGLVLSEDVDEVSASGVEGEFGVLPGHAAFITTLKIGILTTKTAGQSKFYFVNWGYAEVTGDKVLILADSAEKSEEIDLARAEQARQRAEERLRKDDEIDFKRAELALERALTRVQLARHQTK